MAYGFVQAIENSANVGTTGLNGIFGQGTQAASASQTVANPGVFSATQNFTAGLPVYLTGTAPGGFTLNTVYYIAAAGLSTSTCQLAATVGGAGLQCTASASCTINPTVITTAGNTLIGIVHANTVGIGAPNDLLGNNYVQLGHADNGAGQSEFLYLCQNCLGGPNIISSAWNGANLSLLWVGEYSGLVTSGGALATAFNTQNGPGNGANAATSGNLSVGSVPAMLFGFINNNTGSFAPTPGTSPLAFTQRGPNSVNSTGGARANTEDVRITSGGTYAATFGTGTAGADDFNTLAVAIAEATGGALMAWVT